MSLSMMLIENAPVLFAVELSEVSLMPGGMAAVVSALAGSTKLDRYGV